MTRGLPQQSPCFIKKFNCEYTLSDFFQMDFHFFAGFRRLHNAVDDSLIVKDLAGGHGSGSVFFNCIDKGTKLLIKIPCPLSV